ncbi:MAG: OmpA family protein [Proteobacteria bacterium]|nr:OmpA family protein [Pseudomonadota bacterium]
MRKSRGVLAAVLAGFVVSLSYGCSPSYPECFDDSHCRKDAKGRAIEEYCLNGKCAECRNDEHCSSKRDESYICNNGKCQRINGYCNPEAGIHCPAGQKCRDRRCGPECYPETVAEDCKEGQICENNRCVEPPECLRDEDCPAPKICQNRRCVDPPVCQMRLAYFDFDESAIRSDARTVIEQNANCIKERGDVRSTRIVGHCDERGTEEYNMALGKRRADAIRNMLGRLSIRNVTSASRGDLDPVVRGATTEAQHQQNRRGEFLLNQ